MKKMLVSLLIGLSLVGCAKTERVIVQGEKGTDGKDGVSCTASDEFVDGVKVGARITCGETFSIVLNGTDGKDAVSISGTVVSVGSTCTMGGYRLTVGTESYTVCNGLTGETGQPGSVGPAGPQGQPGTVGSNVVPVKLCGKEYGLQIGNKLYAVYHQEVYAGGSGNSGNANSKYSNTYLAELTNGSYVSTDGSNCSFTVVNGSVQ